jgi:hypothetical protein
MTRWLMACGMVGAMVVVGAPAFAQPTTPNAKARTVVMTGCVAIGEKAGDYVLSNPKVEPDPSTPPTATTTPSAPGADPTKVGKVMSYPLKGGDLKGHVGHTVALTGTLDDYKPSTSAHQMPGPTAVMAAESASSVLQVKSVKMISSSCADGK